MLEKITFFLAILIEDIRL